MAEYKYINKTNPDVVVGDVRVVAYGELLFAQPQPDLDAILSDTFVREFEGEFLSTPTMTTVTAKQVAKTAAKAKVEEAA